MLAPAFSVWCAVQIASSVAYGFRSHNIAIHRTGTGKVSNGERKGRDSNKQGLLSMYMTGLNPIVVDCRPVKTQGPRQRGDEVGVMLGV